MLQILITPAEAIQSVSISTTNHDPELGRGTGAVTNVMIKSGTNNFHGAAYEFLQNSAFDARAFFNPSVGHLAYNYVGGNIGGPIKQNKLFFFANYLRTMDHEANTNQTNIPSNEFRTGDLSGDPGHQVYDPTTGTQDGSGQNRTPFPGNIIPASRINPVSAKMLSFLPPTNENFVPDLADQRLFRAAAGAETQQPDRFQSRLDAFRQRPHQRPLQFRPSGDLPGAHLRRRRRARARRLRRHGHAEDLQRRHQLQPGGQLPPCSPRFASAWPTTTTKPSSPTTARTIPRPSVSPASIWDRSPAALSGITINGYSSPLIGYSASLPWDRAEANIDVVNSWTKIQRNHQIKWGVDLRRVRDDLLQDQTFSPRGVITFGAVQTAKQTCTTVPVNGPPSGCSGSSNGLANDMASFLLDVPSQVAAMSTPTSRPCGNGRFSLTSPITGRCRRNSRSTWACAGNSMVRRRRTFPGGFSNYNPDNNTLEIAGIGSNPMNLGLQPQYKYFAPRLGIAYRLAAKTVVRSGFGISYTPFPDNTWMYNFPVRANNQYVSPAGTDNYGPAQLPGGIAADLPERVPGAGSGDRAVQRHHYQPQSDHGAGLRPDELQERLHRDLEHRGATPIALELSAWTWPTSAATASISRRRSNLNAGQVIGAGAAGEPFFAKYGTTAAVTQYFQGFSSTYNSLQVKFDRRFV